MTYAVSQSKLKSTSSLMTNVCPRVRFTGFKPDYQTELGLSFGDYMEAYDLARKQRSNDKKAERTQPCIALYPCRKWKGSGILWSIGTKNHMSGGQNGGGCRFLNQLSIS